MKVLFADDQCDDPLVDWAGAFKALDPDIQVVCEDQSERVPERLRADKDVKALMLDLTFEGQRQQGFDVLRILREERPTFPVVVLTGDDSIETALRCYREGADAYVPKVRIDYASLSFVLKELALGHRGFPLLVGRSDAITSVRRAIDLVARTKQTRVLITGPNGTGKELVARSIHYRSDRREQRFVAVNCAGIPETLLESELFGHKRGAFTGADRDRKGKFEEAHGGTLFLDEIGDMPLALQAKILRTLQEQEVVPLGGAKPVKVDVRVIAATNKNLEEEVKTKRFREDLFYRLNVFPVAMPTLRERIEDLHLLVPFILHRFRSTVNAHIEGISPDALHQLKDCDWPGNIRELENTLERSMILALGDTSLILEPRHFPGLERSDRKDRLRRKEEELVLEWVECLYEKTLTLHNIPSYYKPYVLKVIMEREKGRTYDHIAKIVGMKIEGVKQICQKVGISVKDFKGDR